jgi:hypothetical protein
VAPPPWRQGADRPYMYNDDPRYGNEGHTHVSKSAPPTPAPHPTRFYTSPRACAVQSASPPAPPPHTSYCNLPEPAAIRFKEWGRGSRSARDL